MQNNILPKDLAIQLMPTDENGKFVITTASVKAYIKAVLQYLQNAQKSMNTADFVDAIMQSLDITLDNT